MCKCANVQMCAEVDGDPGTRRVDRSVPPCTNALWRRRPPRAGVPPALSPPLSPPPCPIVTVADRRMPRSVTDMSLPEVEDIVEMDSEMRQILVDISRRQAGGASKGGRYNKHATARLRFVRDKVLMGLRLGILVPDADLRMLRLEPQEQLRQRGGADWLAMEAWAERHGRDPRSQKKDGSLDEAAQQTLLNWVVRNAARFHMPIGVRRGRNAPYLLDFGAYQGYSLLKLIAHANKGGGHLLSNPSEATPPPGQYVLWLASTEFEWQFPRHLKLFFALRALDYQSCRVCDENRGHRPLLVCERAKMRYDAHAASVMSPRDDDVDPYTAATTIGGAAATVGEANHPPPATHAAAAAGAAAAAPTAAAQDNDDDADANAADADPPWRPLNAVDRRENGVPKAQQQYFASVLEEIASGERPEYNTWRRLDVLPDDPLCRECFDESAFELMPIDFWSPAGVPPSAAHYPPPTTPISFHLI